MTQNNGKHYQLTDNSEMYYCTQKGRAAVPRLLLGKKLQCPLCGEKFWAADGELSGGKVARRKPHKNAPMPSEAAEALMSQKKH